MSDALFRDDDGTTSRAIFVSIEADVLRVHTVDSGSHPKEVWGREDYEFGVAVAKENWGALAEALVREFLSGNRHATSVLEAICSRHGVPRTSMRWP